MGYSLKDTEQETKNLAQREAEDNVTVGKNSGEILLGCGNIQLKNAYNKIKKGDKK
jgi:hypothetical protein